METLISIDFAPQAPEISKSRHVNTNNDKTLENQLMTQRDQAAHSDNDEYVVDIMDRRVTQNDMTKYLARWKGYPARRKALNTAPAADSLHRPLLATV